MGISEFAQKVIGDKREWRAYKARVRRLPEPYRVAVDGIERYLFYFGAVEADTSIAIFTDVADIFERAAADGTPIREIVGDDPSVFVDALIENYEKGGYVAREKRRLGESIAAAEAAQARGTEESR